MSQRFIPCSRCALRQILAAFGANDSPKAPAIYLRCDCQVADPFFVGRTGKAVIELGMPRRLIPDWSCAAIERFDRKGGKAFFYDGTQYDLAALPDFGDAFGEDAAASNIRDLMGYAVRQPSRVRQECADRARLISTAIIIARPDLAWKFDL